MSGSTRKRRPARQITDPMTVRAAREAEAKRIAADTPRIAALTPEQAELEAQQWLR